jgi:hypothetical protein
VGASFSQWRFKRSVCSETVLGIPASFLPGCVPTLVVNTLVEEKVSCPLVSDRGSIPGLIHPSA